MRSAVTGSRIGGLRSCQNRLMLRARTVARRAIPAPVRRRIWAVQSQRHGQHWVRVVMDREIEEFLLGLDPSALDAIEISGDGRAGLPWKSFTSVHYPAFDLLAPHDVGCFDVVICEQVLEHVTDPWKATRALAGLCRPGGHVIISTPFMLRVHANPIDNWRFTPNGLSEVVRSAGLEPVAVSSWGDTWCIRRNHRHWAIYRPWHRVLSPWALRNDPLVPQVVWAFAIRPRSTAPAE